MMHHFEWYLRYCHLAIPNRYASQNSLKIIDYESYLKQLLIYIYAIDFILAFLQEKDTINKFQKVSISRQVEKK